MTAHQTFTERDVRGGLTVRLARSNADIVASQRLRYRVFYQEMHAQAEPDAAAAGMDRDRFDPSAKTFWWSSPMPHQMVSMLKMANWSARTDCYDKTWHKSMVDFIQQASLKSRRLSREIPMRGFWNLGAPASETASQQARG